MAGNLGRRIYRTARWARVRLAVLAAAGWRCTQCGRAGVLEVHHRKPLADGGAPYDPRNLEARCRPCHFNAHQPAVAPDVAEWKAFLADAG